MKQGGRRTLVTAIVGALLITAIAPARPPGVQVLAATAPSECYDGPFADRSRYECLAFRTWAKPSGTGIDYVGSSNVQGLEADPTRSGRLRGMKLPLALRIRAMRDRLSSDCRIIIASEFRWFGAPADKSIAIAVREAMAGYPFDAQGPEGGDGIHNVGVPDTLKTDVKVTDFGWRSVVTMPTALTGRTLANSTAVSWLDRTPLASLPDKAPVVRKAEQSRESVGWAPFSFSDSGGSATGTSSWQFREAFASRWEDRTYYSMPEDRVEWAIKNNVQYVNYGRINTTIVRSGSCPSSGLTATLQYHRTVISGNQSCSESEAGTALLSNVLTLATGPFSTGRWFLDYTLQQAMSLGLDWVTACPGETAQTVRIPTITVLPAMYTP